MTLPIFADWQDGQSFPAAAENAVGAALNALGDGSLPIPRSVQTSGAATLALTSAHNVAGFTGSSVATWTLPAITGNTGLPLDIYNRGTATLTVACAGSDSLYLQRDTPTSIAIPPGSTLSLLNDGTFWVALEAPSPVVSFDAVGAGTGPVASAGTTASWTDTIPAATKCAVIWVVDNANANTGMTATIGGTPATLQTSYEWGSFGSYLFYIHCFTLLNPPTGSQVIAFSNDHGAGGAPAANAVYYDDVTSVGTPITTNGTGTSASMSAPSTDSARMYAQCFTYESNTAGSSFSDYNQAQRYVAASDKNSSLVIGDALGNGGTLTFSATTTLTPAYGWGGVILPLNPGV